MPLLCAMSQNANTIQMGRTPVPMVSLGVANPGAAAVVVTGVDLFVTDVAGNPLRGWAGNLPAVPIGFGQTVSVPAGGSISIGPFAFTAPVAGAGSSFQAVPPQATPANSQGALPLQQQVFLRARVYGSDGSVNDAQPAQFFVSYAVPPVPGLQGGYVQFGDQDNSSLIAAVL